MNPSAPAKVRTRMPTMPKCLWLSIRRDINRGMSSEEVAIERKRHKEELKKLLVMRGSLKYRLGGSEN